MNRLFVVLAALAAVELGSAAALAGEPRLREVAPIDQGVRIALELPGGDYATSVRAAREGGRAILVIEVRSATAPDGPLPPPGPPGPPPPNPDPLPGRFGLAASVRKWAAELQIASREDLRAGASALAGSFRSVAARIAAGALPETANLLAETRRSNNQALGDRQAAWKPWGARLAERLDALHREGRLRTPADYAEAWLEVAAGLEAVR